MRCDIANATATCFNGACAVGRCAAPFGDCDGNPANGCESNLLTQASHCGACGAACAGAGGRGRTFSGDGGGGGGGGGWFGGGGGGAGAWGCGGGGGSGFAPTGGVTLVGSGATPPRTSDVHWSPGVGVGGAPGAMGNDGRVVIFACGL